MMAIDLVDKNAAGTATGIVGVASYVGAALQDLLSGHFIQAGRSVVVGKTQYDFSVAGGLWIGAAVLSSLLTVAVWLLSRRRA
jgi:OPA family sugar phosphate sensor protein UhpC-like MFS transporter